MPNQWMRSVRTTSQAVYLPLGRENDLKIAWILQFTTASPGTTKTRLTAGALYFNLLSPKLITFVKSVVIKNMGFDISTWVRTLASSPTSSGSFPRVFEFSASVPSFENGYHNST